MSTFWSNWVIVLTVLNIVGCLWLIRWTMKKRAGESEQGDVTGHTWDGDLQEFNNPLPRWWLYLFYLTLVFATGYLILFPGLGNFKGTLGWSSTGTEYAEEMAEADAKYGPIYQQYASVSVEDLATKAQYQPARDMGKRLFLTYCMQCHGSDAAGAKGYPNLTDKDWAWGGTPAAIEASIANGRQAVMPPHGHLPAETLDTLASWLSGDASAAKAGKEAFTSSGCLGCHGLDATGNPVMGAPNLVDNVWLYGGSKSAILETLQKGRMGKMPAHKALLGDDKVHLLTSYVYSLSH